ncbi:UNKNOWN [Stylonychia lemnae]|uniref:Uncharacterized protein n=1 Tax=Stylonychia lemnae TaxID=5949 RepID=A0A078AKP5_STYLE|nr:UNKNOWN [Stylonychia lemnae]|eukprot:CDW82784.1 UNKNOWN [Stylonychia lemnae]
MGFFVVAAIIGGSGFIAWLLGKNRDTDTSQEFVQKYMMVEDKYIIENQSMLEFNNDLNESQVQNMRRRANKSYKQLSQKILKELKDFKRPFPTELRHVPQQQMKALVDILLNNYKIYRTEFKTEILENRIELLRKKMIGQYIFQKLQDLKDCQLIFQDVFEAVCDELQINSNDFYTMINQFIMRSQYGVSTIEELVIGIKPDKIPPHKRLMRVEAVKNMLYVLSEMRIIIEEYKELQIFVRESEPEDLQEVIDGLQFDLFYMYYGLREDQQRRLIDVHDINTDNSVQQKYEEFYEIMKFFKNIPESSEAKIDQPDIMSFSTPNMPNMQ